MLAACIGYFKSWYKMGPGYLGIFLLEFLFQFFLHQRPFVESVFVSAIYFFGYLLILWSIGFFNPIRLAIAYLIFPLIIFLAGWLQWPVAWLLAVAVLFACNAVFKQTKNFHTPELTPGYWGAFYILICWIHLSGAGGHGYQSVDYIMHNGRLLDLVINDWPVRYNAVLHDWPVPYENEKNLVFYLSYYLPAALVGKTLGEEAALLCMYFGSLLGIMLVFQLLLLVTKFRWPWLLAIVLVFFGGWDIVGLYVTDVFDVNKNFGNDFSKHLLSIDFWAQYWSGEDYQRFYPSNTFQLYYAPHQIIAGWMITLILLLFFLRGHHNVLFFIASFYVFWSPMMLLAILPVAVAAILLAGLGNLRRWFSLESSLAGMLIAGVFMAYYASGPAAKNPVYFFADDYGWSASVVLLLPVYLFGWGIYALLVTPFVIQKEGTSEKQLYYSLIFSLVALSMFRFGAYNDLMLRGAAPLMLMLLVFLARAMEFYMTHKKPFAVVVLLVLLPGIFSAVFWLKRSVEEYHHTRSPVSVSHYAAFNYEQLGKEDSFFFRFLAKPPAPRQELFNQPLRN